MRISWTVKQLPGFYLCGFPWKSRSESRGGCPGGVGLWRNIPTDFEAPFSFPAIRSVLKPCINVRVMYQMLFKIGERLNPNQVLLDQDTSTESV